MTIPSFNGATIRVVHPAWAVSSYSRTGEPMFTFYDDEESARWDALARGEGRHEEIRMWRLEAEVLLNPTLVPPTNTEEETK